MLDVPLDGGPVELRGALGARRTPTGVKPRRLPEWTTLELPDERTDVVVSIPSGVRLAFATAATRLELDVALCDREDVGLPRIAAASSFDLVLDGGEPRSVRATGPTATVCFAGLPPDPKNVELWLPQDRVVELRALRSDAAVGAPEDQPQPRWIHYGSSISQCRGARSPTRTWPALTARMLQLDLVNLGLAGSCHLDPFVARTIRDQRADIVSLEVGINVAAAASMTLRTFAPAVHGMLDTIRDGHPDIPLLLVSPIICPQLEDQPGPATLEQGQTGARLRVEPCSPDDEQLTLRRVRAAIDDLVARRAPLDPRLFHLNGLCLFGIDDAGDLADGIHPSGDGYERIGERFAAQAATTGWLPWEHARSRHAG